MNENKMDQNSFYYDKGEVSVSFMLTSLTKRTKHLWKEERELKY